MNIFTSISRQTSCKFKREATSSTNSNNSSIDWKKLQPEMEICNRK